MQQLTPRPKGLTHDEPHENATRLRPGWIPVSERLPIQNEFFLGFGPGLGNHIRGPNMDICLWDGYMFWQETGTELLGSTGVTHWMPLPGAPL